MDNSNQKTEAIKQLLDEFNGDWARAAQSLRQYSLNNPTQPIIKKPTVQPTGPVIIEVASATKSYKVGKQKISALNNASLKIHEGEFVALTGASGSGKSTMLQLIGGLDKPTSGTVRIAGNDLKTMRDSQLATFRNKTIGFVFQFFYLQPFLKIRTNLEVPAMFAKTKAEERKMVIDELAQSVGLTDRLTHLPRELSGGQIQRVAVARALVNRPKILLADEPTGNLDSKNGNAIIELFEQIRKQYGTTIVVVTHDQAIAARADREIRLSDGAVI